MPYSAWNRRVENHGGAGDGDPAHPWPADAKIGNGRTQVMSGNGLHLTFPVKQEGMEMRAGKRTPTDLTVIAHDHLLEQAAPFCVVDRRGQIISENAAFGELLPELLSRTDGADNGLGPLAAFSEEIEQLQLSQERWSPVLESRLRIVNGAGQELHPQLRAYADSENELQLLVVRFLPDEDTTRLRRQRTEARERFEDISRLVSDWVWETDRDLKLTYISNRVLETLGAHPRSFIGRPLPILFSGDTSALENLTRESSRHPFRDLSLMAKATDGSTRHILVSAVPVFSQTDGIFQGFRGTARDITELLSREAALRENIELAESANRTKSQFLATVSHELRTPLNAIIGFSQLMETETFGPLGNDTYKGYAQDILHSAHHLLELINDVLDVSKIEAGRMELNEERLDFAQLVISALRMVREKASEVQISLETSIEDLLPPIQGDMRALLQVLVNLLSNAVKFTNESGQVHLQAGLDSEGRLVCQIRDSGIGMTPEDIDIALTPFGQVDSQLSRRYSGTGLGLPLTRGLIELHEGDLTIDSTPGEGTSVSFVLPASRVLQA